MDPQYNSKIIKIKNNYTVINLTVNMNRPINLIINSCRKYFIVSISFPHKTVSKLGIEFALIKSYLQKFFIKHHA